MPEKHGQIEQISDPEVLKSMLNALFKTIRDLEGRLLLLEKRHAGKDEMAAVIAEKRDRLEKIRHGLTEMNERMERPYVVSAELQAVKEVMDVLAKAGECNSVILEGEPGTGKTQWAYSEVGRKLQKGEDVILVHIRVKDTMRAQDLLYRIDDVRRLSDAQAQAQVPEQIRQEASLFRQKILDALIDPMTDKDYLAFRARMNAIVELGETAKDLDHLNYVDLGPLGEAICQSGKGSEVFVVIDEIEKGRVELMTSMLDELEHSTFTIEETGTVVKGDKKNLRIIITTNTEDSDKIPTSFRRRSLYHFIDYPGRADMAKIVELNFPNIQPKLLNYAISVFYQYHENPEVVKKPSTPELLAWVRVLSMEFNGSIPKDVPHREILLKYKEDQELDIGRKKVKAAEEAERHEGEMPHFAFKAIRGERVFHLDSRINSSYDQYRFSEFFATLQNEGVSFVTPIFQERDRYADEETVQKNVRSFQLIMPGIEYLGDGYYVIPEDKIKLLQSVIDRQIVVLPAGQKFTSVSEKSKNLTKGTVDIDGQSCDAYMGEDGRFIVSKPFNL